MIKAKNVLVLLIAAIFTLCGSAAFAESVVITGTVNGHQVMTESGMVYDIGENEIGDELMEQEGKKVEVKGTVTKHEEGEDVLVLMVTEFEIKD